MTTNYYQLLKIENSATSYDIKKAFRREIAIYHPDNNSSPEAKADFEKLVEAFDILSDDTKRYHYDQMLKSKATNKPVVFEQKEQYKEWQKEAKKKSKKYRESYSLEDLLLLDLFILNGDVFDGFLSGAEDVFDGLTDGVSDIFDLF